MINKPEEVSNKLFLWLVAGAMAICVSLFCYTLYGHSFVDISGKPFTVFAVYMKACLNPFDQQYCQLVLSKMATADAQQFRLMSLLTAVAAIMAAGCFGYWAWFTAFRRPPRYIKAGFTVAGFQELKAASDTEIKNTKIGIKWFSDLHLSRLREVTHFLVFGAIGGGKTQTIMPLLNNVMERGDKAVIFDFKGDYTQMAFSKPSGEKKTKAPLILAPHDSRSVIWDIARDLSVEEDAIEVANRIIPESRDRFFSDSARAVLALCIITLMREKGGKWTWWELMETTQLPLEKLQAYAEQYHPDAKNYLNADYRQVAATISTMAAGLGAVRMLAYGWREENSRIKFSLREWLLNEETKDRTLVLQRSGRFQDQSEGWISAFLTVMSANVSDVSFGDSETRRIWLFADEFAQLPKVHRFEAMLETGRSKGLACVLGIQGMEQLVVKYSQALADQLEALVGTKVVARINAGQTAKRLEDQFGETLFIQNKLDYDGSNERWVREERKEPVVHRSEFQTTLGPGLNKRGVFVLFSGLGKHIYRVLIPYSKLQSLRPAEMAAEWTQQLRTIFTDPESQAKQAAMGEADAARFNVWETDFTVELDRLSQEQQFQAMST